MAGEFDFEPVSDAALQPHIEQRGWVYPSDGRYYVQTTGEIVAVLDLLQRMAREIRAWRAAGRTLVEANDDHTPAGRLRWEKAAADIRALMAHVEGGK